MKRNVQRSFLILLFPCCLYEQTSWYPQFKIPSTKAIHGSERYRPTFKPHENLFCYKVLTSFSSKHFPIVIYMHFHVFVYDVATAVLETSVQHL
jgi:hypothetical protein